MLISLFAGISQATAASDTNAVPGQLIVGFKKQGLSRSQALAVIKDTNAQIVNTLAGGDSLVAVPAGENLESYADRLEATDGIKYASPNYIVRASATTNDPLVASGQAWGLQQLRAIPSWKASRGDGALVAIVDSGVTLSNPDIAGNLWTNIREIAGNGADDDNNGFVDDVAGADWIDRDGDPTDRAGHGTHVAGTIAATADNGIGSAGVAPGAKVMPLRFLDSRGAGNVGDAIAAIEYAVAAGADVINASWGGPDYSPPLQAAIQRAGQAGVVVVAAAGNDGENNDGTPVYPASFDLPNLISVAATDQADRLANFSNYGKNNVDIGAPGVEVVATVGDGFGYMNGTSMAAPHVAGIAALLRGVNKGLAADGVVGAIKAGARRTGTLSGRVASGGVADAIGAMQAIGVDTSQFELGKAPGSFRLKKPGRKIKVRGRRAKVKFTWSRAADEDLVGYRVLINGKVQKTVKGLSAKITLRAGKKYRWSVVAIDRAGNSTTATRASKLGKFAVVSKKR